VVQFEIEDRDGSAKQGAAFLSHAANDGVDIPIRGGLLQFEKPPDDSQVKVVPVPKRITGRLGGTIQRIAGAADEQNREKGGRE